MKQRERDRRDPEEVAGEDASSQTPEAAETAAVLATAGNPNYTGDARHLTIVGVLGDKVDRAIEEARENPSSDATQIIRVLLANQLRIMQEAAFQKDPGLLLTEERRRKEDSQKQAEIDSHNVTRLRLQNEKLRLEIQEKKTLLGQAKKAMEDAEKRAADGQPMDRQAVYDRIAEIVGLRPPPDQPRQQ